jgi:hypothetical protein
VNNCLAMGMSWQDAAGWDFVEYSATLKEWNERHKPRDENGEAINNEPPPIEWMIADDEARGL